MDIDIAFYSTESMLLQLIGEVAKGDMTDSSGFRALGRELHNAVALLETLVSAIKIAGNVQTDAEAEECHR